MPIAGPLAAPASQAVLGAGATLSVNTGSGLVVVAEVKDINGPGFKVGTVKISNLTSPGMREEKRPGWLDAGQVTLQCNYTALQYATLLNTLQLQYPWRITTNQGSHWDFTAHITEISSEIPLEEAISMPITLDITGTPAPLFTA